MIKIYEIRDVKRFLAMINECEGNVYLLSKQGDKLNLKSKLTQYIALTDVLGVNSEFTDLELETENKNDEIKIVQYLIGAR